MLSASVDGTIRKKNQTPTWVTTSAISLDYGYLFQQLLQRYQWTSLAVIVDPYSININQSRNIAGQIYRRLQSEGLKVLARDLSKTEDPTNQELLSVIRQTCRGINSDFLSERTVKAGVKVLRTLRFPCSCCLLWRCSLSTKSSGKVQLGLSHVKPNLRMSCVAF